MLPLSTTGFPALSVRLTPRSAAGSNLGIEPGSCPRPLYLDVRSLLFNERDATYNEQYKALC